MYSSNMSGTERKPNFIEKGAARSVEALAPISKALDKLFIGGGVLVAGVGLALQSLVLVQGAVAVIGINLATLAFAGGAEKWAHKKLGK
jgi:hypothetical protein